MFSFRPFCHNSVNSQLFYPPQIASSLYDHSSSHWFDRAESPKVFSVCLELTDLAFTGNLPKIPAHFHRYVHIITIHCHCITFISQICKSQRPRSGWPTYAEHFLTKQGKALHCPIQKKCVQKTSAELVISSAAVCWSMMYQSVKVICFKNLF